MNYSIMQSTFYLLTQFIKQLNWTYQEYKNYIYFYILENMAESIFFLVLLYIVILFLISFFGLKNIVYLLKFFLIFISILSFGVLFYFVSYMILFEYPLMKSLNTIEIFKMNLLENQYSLYFFFIIWVIIYFALIYFCFIHKSFFLKISFSSFYFFMHFTIIVKWLNTNINDFLFNNFLIKWSKNLDKAYCRELIKNLTHPWLEDSYLFNRVDLKEQFIEQYSKEIHFKPFSRIEELFIKFMEQELALNKKQYYMDCCLQSITNIDNIIDFFLICSVTISGGYLLYSFGSYFNIWPDLDFTKPVIPNNFEVEPITMTLEDANVKATKLLEQIVTINNDLVGKLNGLVKKDQISQSLIRALESDMKAWFRALKNLKLNPPYDKKDYIEQLKGKLIDDLNGLLEHFRHNHGDFEYEIVMNLSEQLYDLLNCLSDLFK